MKSFYQNSSTINSFTGPNRYPVVTSLIHIESRKLPTKSLFDAGSSRISIFIVNTYSITRMFWQISQGYCVGLLLTACELDDVQLSCLLKEQLLEPALNLTVHCCGLEFRVLNGYDQKSFDEERGLNCVVQTSLP
ncbi:hypothetical protein Tco_0644870 [Tanacetum coccineum]